MQENANANTATEAVIYFKDGKRKYGFLIDDYSNCNNYFQFISNLNFNLFQETKNPTYIEIVPESLIKAIETDLK